MKNAVEWSGKRRSRKADQGHSAVRYGTSHNHNGFIRTYIECECGKVYSGNGHEGGFYGHLRHMRKEGVQGA